jgi:hypothetical protein
MVLPAISGSQKPILGDGSATIFSDLVARIHGENERDTILKATLEKIF